MPPLLHSNDVGQGEALVFLHGFCETHEIWDEFVNPLKERFRIITIDLPGFGNSDILPGPFTIDAAGDALANHLEKKHLEKSVLIGHSLGGYVALSLAANHPELVGGLVLFHSTSFADTPEKKENRNKVIEFVRRNGVQPFIDTFVPGLFFDKLNPMIQQMHRIASATKMETLIGYSQAMRDRPDRSSVLKNSALRKLLIAGEEDALVTLHTSLEMVKMGKNLSFLALKKTGHMGFFEAKTECQEIIASFTDGLRFNK